MHQKYVFQRTMEVIRLMDTESRSQEKLFEKIALHHLLNKYLISEIILNININIYDAIAPKGNVAHTVGNVHTL